MKRRSISDEAWRVGNSRPRKLVLVFVIVALSTGGAALSSRATGRVPDPVIHRVAKGENLSRIAQQYDVSIADITAANKLSDRHHVRIAQILVIPVRVPDPQLPARLRAEPRRLALRPIFARWARANAIPIDLLEATAWLESGWNQRKVSSTGAIGIGQLMPDTARFVAHDLIGRPLDPKQPEDNIRMSARMLRFLLQHSQGDVDVALCAYYQGLRSMRKNGVYRETKRYAADIQALRPLFRSRTVSPNLRSRREKI